ncbi:DUF4389 domain-containing protein, partial [Vibrio cholerae]|uniref:DUF4389 domain-containing protein n=1 Tax=Vibrio cholerae TaxID=666 RepID=UPI001BD16BA4|nr:DUF4389 domain-containing protein [Vibrio cholerae]
MSTLFLPVVSTEERVMNDSKAAPQYESIVLRILWMLVFALVWQVAQLLLGALVVVQLIYRLI